MTMLSATISILTKDGVSKPTPAAHIRADRWSSEAVQELFSVLAERAGAIGGVGVLPAWIRPTEGRFSLAVATENESAIAEPLAIPIDVLQSCGYPLDGTQFRLNVRPHRFTAIDLLDLHLPVFAGTRVDNERIEPRSPYVYGTAFPIWHGGLLLTAAHVLDSARASGEVVVGRLGEGPGPIPAYGVERAEVFPEYDLALLKCPGLEKFPPIALEMEKTLGLFDEVRAVGYPFSVDPEHLIATHRGFAGHVVAFRQLFQLPGQPLGYELSFQTPPGMSGAPLTHVDQEGTPRCYGYVVQQMDVEFCGVHVRLGLAVSMTVLRAIQSRFLKDQVVSEWFGVARAPQPPLRSRRSPANAPPSIEDWPDD
jgi:hypothetical protein